jgi:hypothetical protein
MKDIYEVLRQKELQLSRLEKEVEALRVAAPLLSEDDEADNNNKPTFARSRATNATPQPNYSGWDDTAILALKRGDASAIRFIITAALILFPSCANY